MPFVLPLVGTAEHFQHCADDLAALPIKSLLERNPQMDATAIDDVVFGCANQAGEDNRNIARMTLLLAGVPLNVPGTTVNRLCGSNLDVVAIAARTIKSGEADLMIVGEAESMSRYGQGRVGVFALHDY